MKQWTFIDRTEWPSGEWDNEPDKVQWTDEATGLVCLLHRGGHSGAWCGYVGVPPSHPAYKQPYDDMNVDVHCGLTFADLCDPSHDEQTGRGICHVPEPGEPDDVWWIGFDCAHAFDLSPGMAKYREILPPWDETYRNMAYAQEQTAYLARQLADMI